MTTVVAVDQNRVGTPARRYVVADVFASTPLLGNPVAVFLDSEGLSGERMQQIAREMNLSETTFVLPPEKGGYARVRIFTPVNELPFAGHPLLGTAIALADADPVDEMALETREAIIPFAFNRSADGVLSATMVQPVPQWQPYDLLDTLLLGVDVREPTLPVEVYRNGPRHVFVGVEDIAALGRIQPDLRVLATLPDVAVNCFAGSGYHWRSRMFSPAYGVAEDAATGSAAGPLAVHLARHGLIEFGRQIEIMQGVEMGRPSRMLATAFADVDSLGRERIKRVEVAGSAVVVARGSLYV
ncbi:PhzF family phenazine biosynthesis isomerase [Pseudonocardiaceae bacterium YIM PH 21723]|nr:PhzF family phenazine biosynthesis isomerase [Pseudonocardiaceae bacterium YIM PH 21723]